MGKGIRFLGLNSFKLAKDWEYSEVLTAIDEFEFGIPYYLVTIDYQTGDTFGSRSETQYVELFKSPELAKKLIDKLNAHEEDRCKIGYDYSSIEYTVDNGETREYNPVWVGYFETLNNIEVKVLWLVP